MGSDHGAGSPWKSRPSTGTTNWSHGAQVTSAGQPRQEGTPGDVMAGSARAALIADAVAGGGAWGIGEGRSDGSMMGGGTGVPVE